MSKEMRGKLGETQHRVKAYSLVQKLNYVCFVRVNARGIYGGIICEETDQVAKALWACSLRKITHVR